MNYIGEHLLPGRLGHFFCLLSFVSSLVSMVAFYKSSNLNSGIGAQGWKKLARICFAINLIAVFSIFATIYYIVYHHLFEYNFAWEHSSRSLSPKYLLACIWEAQEGSFLLWSLWQSVIGAVLIFTARNWESPVMTVLSFSQLCLAAMIVGLYFLGYKVGLNPFLLVRQLETFNAAPIFNRADYLIIPQMQDGQSLNALLQNYWMVIHPPILFLGLASTVVPFAYSIAGLWKEQYGQWTRVALPWTLFSAGILISGVIMGGAWAYESLSFGGYWAWDPVENASLVPWLVLVAGLHTQLVYNATGHSLRMTHFLFILSFILILYETFLTRSGILGDTSVHAFVDSGMNVQLIGFLFIFLIPALFLFVRRYRFIPHIAKEENTWSREFWMFIGSLVLFLSALFIAVSTSLPVINKILGSKWSVGEDAPFAYNRIEIFVAFILGILTAVTQYLKYKDTPKKFLRFKIVRPTILALVIAAFLSIYGGIIYNKYGNGFLIAIHIALFAAIYAMIANAGYLWTGLRGRMKAAGASVAHFGFALMLFGILISSAKKELLSFNTTGINVNFDASAKQDPLENITLLKNVQTDMGKYWATYLGNDSIEAASKKTFFHIKLLKKDSSNQFDLYPDLMKATKGQQGISANPDKHHYWNKDIFAYVTATDNMEQVVQEDTSGYKKYSAALHDTLYYSKGYMVLNKVVVNPNSDKYHFIGSDTALMAEITVVSRDSMRYKAQPVLYVKNNEVHFIADTIFAQDLAFVLSKVIDNSKIELRVKESSSMVPFVSLKVYEFPQINLVWIGAITMIFGFAISVIRRIKTTGSGLIPV